MWLFTEEAATGIVRTLMAFAWTWAATNIPGVVDFVEGTLHLTLEGFVLIGGTVLYTAIRALAEKFPKVGYLLVFNKKPTYDIAA